MRCVKSVSLGFAAVLTLGLGLAQTASAGPGTGTATESTTGYGQATADDVVRTSTGKVRGTVDEEVRSFQGVPYAAPPVGTLRWQPPEPARPWDGVRDATGPGSPCAQPKGLPIGVPSEQEDCLTLNVTTPAKSPANPEAKGGNGDDGAKEIKGAEGKRPVIVWVHGGSNMVGTGAMYGPKKLAAKGAVVVSMNYRLGVMSFLTHPSLKRSGSLALEDQQAALKWVRANAGAFGGDARNVTLMGESGGGYSVCGHLASPASAGLFDRAIVQSAPCAGGGATRTRAEAEADSTRVVKAVGCENSAGGTAACLRGKTPRELLDAYGAFNEPRPLSGTELLPLTPDEALRTGRFHHVPVLVGVNHDEERGMVLGLEVGPGGKPMEPEEYEPAVREQFGDRADAVLKEYPLSDFPSAGVALSTVKTDALWSAPTLDTARALSRWTPTRMFEFSARDTPWFKDTKQPSFAPRAQHMAELPYLFELNALFEDPTPQQARLSDRMTRTWVRFAETGRTNWPAFHGSDGTGGTEHVRSLREGAWKQTDFAEEHRYGFWAKSG